MLPAHRRICPRRSEEAMRRPVQPPMAILTIRPPCPRSTHSHFHRPLCSACTAAAATSPLPPPSSLPPSSSLPTPPRWSCKRRTPFVCDSLVSVSPLVCVPPVCPPPPTPAPARAPAAENGALAGGEEALEGELCLGEGCSRRRDYNLMRQSSPPDTTNGCTHEQSIST